MTASMSESMNKETIFSVLFTGRSFLKSTTTNSLKIYRLHDFLIYRSIHRRCSVKKGVLRNFTKFTGKYLCQSLFFNKVAGLRPATSLKKKPWYRCCPVNFAKFLKNTFSTEHLQTTASIFNQLTTTVPFI